MYKILVVDDNPLIINAYTQALQILSDTNPNYRFNIDTASTCDEAISLISDSVSNNSDIGLYDMVILDIRVEPSSDGNVLSGEDIALRLRELCPNTKIMISTTFNDNFRIYSLITNVDPDGFLIKNDIKPKELIKAIETVTTDPPYYSKTVSKLLRKLMTAGVALEKHDRILLYELSVGTKMVDIPNIIPFSKPSMERRKRFFKKKI